MNAPARVPLPDVQALPDQRHIAIAKRAYDNPKFVEDLARDVALALQADERVIGCRVACETFESIHNHSVCACIEGDKRAAGEAA